jgi:hypothetical protein
MPEVIHPDIKPGCRVALRASFLRNIADYGHEQASKRGIVLRDNEDLPHCVDVGWDDEPRGYWRTINRANLWPADKLHLEPA